MQGSLHMLCFFRYTIQVGGVDMDKQPVQPPEPLTEEEFLELVLAEKEKALAEERERRLQPQQPKRQRKSIRFIVWIIAFALIFNTFALLLNMYSIPAIEFLKVSAKLSGEPHIQQYKKAVVEVSTGDSKGTGFAISEDGYILTNDHVIEDALQLTVVFPDDGLYEAEVVASYPEIDTALIKVDGEDLPYLDLATSPAYEPEEAIYFIGNPLSFTGIANKGTLLEFVQLEDWTQPVMMMQAPVYKGNSGSPVINEQGLVIGIVFATMDTDDYGKVGLFVPIDYFNEK